MLIFFILIFLRPFICSLAFPYLNSIYSVFLLVFLAGYIIFCKPLRQLKPALGLPLAIFLAAVFVSLIFSSDPAVSAGQVYQYISAIGLFLVGITIGDKDRRLSLRAVVFSATAISLLALYQYFFSFKHLDTYLADNRISFSFAADYIQSRRVFFPFVTPGVLGGFLAMVLPLTFTSRRKFWLAPLLCFVILLTKSPAAFVSLFFGVSVYLCLKGKLNRSSILLLAGILLLIVGVFIWRSWAQKEHLRPVFSISMRLNYWRESLGMVREYFISGVGLGNFNLHHSRYAHNSYLQILAEMGVLGFSAFLWLVFAALKRGVARLKETPDKETGYCLAAASTVFLAHNLMDFTFFLPETALVFWLVLGLFAA
jgi:putative inorganic carbon (hco3(-)) transporter